MFSLKRVIHAYRNRPFPDFLRFLLQLEREKRLNITQKTRSWYNRQIFLSYCNHVGFGLHLGPRDMTLKIKGNVDFTVGNNVSIFTPINISLNSYFCSYAELSIGDETHIGSGSMLRVAKSIRIGRHCLIARNVRIFDYSGHPLEPSMRLERKKVPQDEIRPVVIEDNVWIGENAIINAGVTVGANSIVAANALVTKNVPENVIVLGNPARPIYWFKKSDDQDSRNSSSGSPPGSENR